MPRIMAQSKPGLLGACCCVARQASLVVQALNLAPPLSLPVEWECSSKQPDAQHCKHNRSSSSKESQCHPGHSAVHAGPLPMPVGSDCTRCVQPGAGVSSVSAAAHVLQQGDCDVARPAQCWHSQTGVYVSDCKNCTMMLSQSHFCWAYTVVGGSSGGSMLACGACLWPSPTWRRMCSSRAA
jgi:hypothetical protein